MKKEANSDETNLIGPLKSVINDLSSKEVSLVQIGRDDTGVITFTENDFQWIEQLSRAILITNDDHYFQRADQPINFDFLYLQSYIIRTHLLLCPINYEHIIQNYQCYVRRTHLIAANTMLDLDERYCVQLNDQQLKFDWNHLKEMQLDKLYHGHHLLRQICLILKHHQEDSSRMNLFEFLQSLGNDQNIRQQIEQYEIKDFQLRYIDHIRTLYANSISDFEHLFTDVSQTLRSPIDPPIENELSETLRAAIVSVDTNDNVNQIQSTIKQITDLLNDLRSIEHHLSGQAACFLKETCQILEIKNPILDFLPDGIKCENYVALSIQIIRMRNILQEQVVNIEERETTQWDESLDVLLPQAQQQFKPTNRFRDLLADSMCNEFPNEPVISDDEILWPDIPDDIQQDRIMDYLIDQDQPQLHQRPIIPPVTTDQERPTYSSFFQLNIKLVKLSSSGFFDKIRKQLQEPPAAIAPLNKAQKFIVNYPNGEAKTSLWRSENLFERLRAIFEKEGYDFNKYVVVDKNRILVDLTNPNARLPREISLEYFIIERTSIFPIQFHFQAKTFEYFITVNCDISNLIHRFISDYDIQLSSKDALFCFFDQHGKTLDNVSIIDLTKRMNLFQERTISITLTEEDENTTMLYEVTFTSNDSK